MTLHKLVNGTSVPLSQNEIDEFNQRETEHQAYLASEKYLYDQAIAARKYPDLPTQLDMLYHDLKDGTSTWVNTITSIKIANPLPTEAPIIEETQAK